MIRCIVWIATLYLMSSCSTSTGITNADATLRCRNVAQEIYRSLDQESLATLRAVEERADVIQFHLSWGMGIRNEYGLWGEDSSIRKSCAAMVGKNEIHPDTASTIIMEEVWALAHEHSLEEN